MDELMGNTKCPERCCLVVITTAQLHSYLPELRFCAGLNRSGSLTMVSAGNKAKLPSSVNHTTKTTHHHHQLKCHRFFCFYQILKLKFYNFMILPQKVYQFAVDPIIPFFYNFSLNYTLCLLCRCEFGYSQ